MKGEVAAYEEASSGYGKVWAPEEDVVSVKEAAAVRACSVVWGGGAMTE
jgi:heptaprenylglyceryl phosphate synthase